jgi:hypothetical protein
MTDTAERLSLPEVPGNPQEATLFDPGWYDVSRTLQFPDQVQRSTDLQSMQHTLDCLRRARLDGVPAEVFIQLGSRTVQLVEQASVNDDQKNCYF